MWKIHKIPCWCFCTGFLCENMKFQRVPVSARKFQRNLTKTQDFLCWFCCEIVLKRVPRRFQHVDKLLHCVKTWNFVSLCFRVKFQQITQFHTFDIFVKLVCLWRLKIVHIHTNSSDCEMLCITSGLVLPVLCFVSNTHNFACFCCENCDTCFFQKFQQNHSISHFLMLLWHRANKYHEYFNMLKCVKTWNFVSICFRVNFQQITKIHTFDTNRSVSVVDAMYTFLSANRCMCVLTTTQMHMLTLLCSGFD